MSIYYTLGSVLLIEDTEITRQCPAFWKLTLYWTDTKKTTNGDAVSVNSGYNGNLSSQVAQWLRIHLPMQETQTRDLGSIPGSGRSPLEEGMATHCSILAWRIPWTEDSGRLQYIGSQRVRHDLSQ